MRQFHRTEQWYGIVLLHPCQNSILIPFRRPFALVRGQIHALPMDVTTGAIIAAFGILGLLITLTASRLRQLPDLIDAFREVRRYLRSETPESSDDAES